MRNSSDCVIGDGSFGWPATAVVERLARGLLILVAGFTIVYALAIMALNVGLPAQVDVWEGKLLCESYRWRQTGSFYDDPVTNGAASIYTPLYQITLGILAGSLPPAFAWGRLLSMIATMATGLVILAWCGLLSRAGEPAQSAPGSGAGLHRQDSPALWPHAWLVWALFMSCAWNTDWFAVMVKTDALCHALWITGALLSAGRRTLTVIAGAMLMALAFYVKQTALFAVPGVGLFLLVHNRKLCWRWSLAYTISMAAGWLAFASLAGEWMQFYLIGRTAAQVERTLPGAEMWRVLFTIRDLPLLVLGTMAAIGCYPLLNKNRRYHAALWILPFVFAGSVWTTTAPGAGPNSMMPLLYMMVVLSGFGVTCLVRSEMASDWRVPLALSVLLLVQFDNRAPYRVSKSLGRFDRDFVEVVDYLREQPGSVYAPTHNVFTLLLERPVYDDLVLAREIGWHFRDAEPQNRIGNRVNSGAYQWLIMDKPHGDANLFTPKGRDQYIVALETDTWTVFKRLQ